MFTRSNSNGTSTLTVTANSVIDSNVQAVFLNYNRVILDISFIGRPETISIQNQLNGRGIKVNVPTIDNLTIDITHLIDFPFTYNSYSTFQYIDVGARYIGEPAINIRMSIVEALNGKSYPFREPVTTYRQIPDNSNTIELFSPFNGILQSGTTTQPIRQGLNIVDLANVGDSFYITNDFITTFDHTFDHTFRLETTSYSVNIDRVCAMNSRAVLINYVNANGESSYLIGYATDIENGFDGENYQSNAISVFNKQTKLHLYEHRQEMTVVVPNITYEAYPSDIMLNEQVSLTFNNKVYTASPIADASNTSDDYQDYSVKFRIL